MKLAFWKRKRPRRSSPDLAAAGAQPAFDEAADEADAAAAATLLRVRTRRRLIGACALLLAVVVLVPMLLDPTPRAVPDNIPIDLPSDRTPFAPRPAAPAPAPVTGAADGAAGVPAAPGSAADTAADAAPAGAEARPPAGSAPSPKSVDEAGAQGKKHSATPAEPAKGEAKHTAHKAEPSAVGQGKIFVQAAAMAEESAAQKLADRLSKSGLTPFVERTHTTDGVRFRVRLGPFASRDDAERMRQRLQALRVSANIVGA